MKSYIISILGFSAIAAAQPRHGHRHPHNRRDAEVDVVTEMVYATQPAAVVYVNQDGVPWSTSLQAQPASTEVPFPSNYEPPPPAAPAPTSEYNPPAPETTEASPPPAEAADSSHQHLLISIAQPLPSFFNSSS